MRRGGYVAGAPPDAPCEMERVELVHRQLNAFHVFCNVSAATIWGYPRWLPSGDVHIIQRYRASGHAAADIVRHRVPLGKADVAMCDGLPVTSQARTVVDCALAMHPLEALVIADAALRLGLHLADIWECLNERGRVRGVRRAQVTLALADGGADSPWETWLRYLVIRAGLPRPVTQFRVDTRLGARFIDIAWPEYGVLVEFDGKVKYRDGAFGNRYDADEARFQEKRRADAIQEACGRTPLRITAWDRPGEIIRRILALFPATPTYHPNPHLPAPPPFPKR